MPSYIEFLRSQHPVESQPKIDAAIDFLRKETKPLSRTIKPGQMAYAYIQAQRGNTTIPKFGVLLRIEQVYDSYVTARVLSCANPYNTSANIGRLYTASKSCLERVDLNTLLNAERDPMSRNINRPHRHLLVTLAQFIQTPSLINQYYTTKRGRAADRLKIKMAQYETRTGFRAWPLDDARYHYNNTFFNGYREDLKNLGKAMAGFKRTSNGFTDPIAKANYLKEVLASSGGNRFRYTTERQRATLNRWLNDHLTTNNLITGSCGHYMHQEETPTTVWQYQGRCQACIDHMISRYGQPVDALQKDGTTIKAFPGDCYHWEDGTYRTYEEPPVIAGYHSSKNLFTQSLPHITGDMPHKSCLKVGYELEFVMRSGSTKSDNTMARLMKKTINETMDELFGEDSATNKYVNQPYAGFERDGSVDFEMVSGYGPLDIHRAVLGKVLALDELRKNLASHDGSRCGLHVHLDKPKSLMHSVRMQAFYNSPMNEHLIRAVARRYGRNSGYAKFKGEKGSMAEAAKQYKQNVLYNRDKRTALSRAITNLTSERYEVLNFLNDRTVEVRAFRGSLVLGSVLACLEFAFMSWYFCRDTTHSKLTTEAFLQYVSLPEWRHETRYLRKYLWGKGFKVWMPKKQPRAQAVEA